MMVLAGRWNLNQQTVFDDVVCWLTVVGNRFLFVAGRMFSCFVVEELLPTCQFHS
jgi:hypothetical protein